MKLKLGKQTLELSWTHLIIIVGASLLSSILTFILSVLLMRLLSQPLPPEAPASVQTQEFVRETIFWGNVLLPIMMVVLVLVSIRLARWLSSWKEGIVKSLTVAFIAINLAIQLITLFMVSGHFLDPSYHLVDALISDLLGLAMVGVSTYLLFWLAWEWPKAKPHLQASVLPLLACLAVPLVFARIFYIYEIDLPVSMYWITQLSNFSLHPFYIQTLANFLSSYVLANVILLLPLMAFMRMHRERWMIWLLPLVLQTASILINFSATNSIPLSYFVLLLAMGFAYGLWDKWGATLAAPAAKKKPAR